MSPPELKLTPHANSLQDGLAPVLDSILSLRRQRVATAEQLYRRQCNNLATLQESITQSLENMRVTLALHQCVRRDEQASHVNRPLSLQELNHWCALEQRALRNVEHTQQQHAALLAELEQQQRVLAEYLQQYRLSQLNVEKLKLLQTLGPGQQ